MDNFLMLTDIHLGIQNESPIFFDICKKLHKEILSYDVDYIFNLGDFFHNRNFIGLKTMQIAKEIGDMIEYSGKEYYIVVGNHDTHYKTSLYPNSLIPLFEKYKHIHIVDSPVIIDNVTLVPWNTDVNEIETNEILMGHFEINSFPVTNKREASNSWQNISDFSRFGQVYSGHFHLRSEKNNIMYIGSAFQQNFGDMGHQRGFYVYEDGKLTFFEFEAPKFVLIFTENMNFDNIEGNFVRLVFEKDYGNTKNINIIKEIESKKPLKLQTDFGKVGSIENVEKNKDFVQIKGNRELLFEYIEKTKIPENLQKRTLFGIIDSLIKEES